MKVKLLLVALVAMSCSASRTETSEAMEVLRMKAMALDSLVAVETGRLKDLDSTLNVEMKKSLQLDSIINIESGRIDSLVKRVYEKIDQGKNP
jgi:hypothetical protein